MNISFKLLAGFLAIASLIVVVGYASVAISKGELTHSIGDQAVDTARERMDKIDRYIYTRIEQAEAYSKTSSMQGLAISSNREFDGLGDIQAYIDGKDKEWRSAQKTGLNPFMEGLISNDVSEELRRRLRFFHDEYNYSVFGEIFLTNRYGANIAQTSKTSDYNQADEEWWQITRDEGLYVGEVEYDESSSVYSVSIGTRIEDDAGEFIGVMKSVLDVGEIVNIVNKASATHEHDEESADFHDIKLLTRDRKVIYSTENYSMFEDISADILAGLTSDDGYFMMSENEKEGNELVAYVNSYGSMKYKGLGWILVSEYDEKRILQPVNRLMNSLLTIAAMITIIAVIIGLIIARAISGPIQDLNKGVEAVEKGDLSIRVGTRADDELGRLSRSFDKMVLSLKQSRTQLEDYSKNLESKVKERTELLEQKERELMDANLKLKDLDKQKDAFISIAAHELKTPLTSIKGFAQVLKESELDKAERDSYIALISKNSDRLYKLVLDLVDSSRISLGQIKVHEEIVDPYKAIDDIKDNMTAQIREKGIEPVFSIEENLPKLRCDYERLLQVLRNLITNAIHYTDKGSITIRAYMKEGMMQFEVRDTGEGIPKNEQDKLFSRFYQVDSTLKGRSGGSGLGLSVCKGLIELMKGEIWFESELGKGTAFYFKLPIVHDGNAH